MKSHFFISAIVSGMCFTGFAQSAGVHDQLRKGLMDADAALANQAVGACAAKGVGFLPTLREWSKSDDPRLRLRARSAIGRVTGQWGSQTDLIWRKDFGTASKEALASVKTDAGGVGKPIMLLQLFGSLNKEYC